MIGPRANALIRRLIHSETRRVLSRRALLWAAAAALAESLATLLGILGLLSESGFHAASLLFLSTFPCVLFFPPEEKTGPRVLRSVDKRAILESALASTEENAAEPMLRASGEALAEERRDFVLPHRKPSRAERNLVLGALAAAAAAQIASLSMTGEPALGYTAPPPGIGQAKEGAGEFTAPEEREESLLAEPGEGEAAGVEDRPGTTGRSSESDFPDISGLLRSERAWGEFGHGGEAQDSEEGSSKPGSEGDRAPREGPPGLPGEPGTGQAGSSPESGDAQAEGQGSGSRSQPPGEDSRAPAGGEGTGSFSSSGSLAKNAMKDYRASFERIYTERTHAAVAAGDELSLAEWERAVGRYFDSFQLRIGVEPEEDPFVAGLRAAWLRARKDIQ